LHAESDGSAYAAAPAGDESDLPAVCVLHFSSGQRSAETVTLRGIHEDDKHLIVINLNPLSNSGARFDLLFGKP
jgi:hypothetical protein